MSVRLKLPRRLRKQHGESPSIEGAGIGRREFMERTLIGAAVFSISWLATDEVYEEYSSPYEEKWLRDYYKSDFVGV